MSNQSLMFLEEIRKWVDDGSPVDVVYLTFQKAYDKVPHQRLLHKLKPVSVLSVLGLILFLMYINDLEDDISSKILKFADDTKVFRKVPLYKTIHRQQLEHGGRIVRRAS